MGHVTTHVGYFEKKPNTMPKCWTGCPRFHRYHMVCAEAVAVPVAAVAVPVAAVAVAVPVAAVAVLVVLVAAVSHTLLLQSHISHKLFPPLPLPSLLSHHMS